jgi:uncharacterized protein YndB with AHSA1/START domain
LFGNLIVTYICVIKRLPMKRDIKLEWHYPYSAAEVWECLTTPALIAEWLMDNDFKPLAGHTFQFRAKPMRGWSGIVDCRVLEVVPNKKLSYTWESGPKPGEIKFRTVVTWHLVPENGGTLLRLEHTGFKGFSGVMVSFILGSGWKGKISKAFAAVLNKQKTGGKEQG